MEREHREATSRQPPSQRRKILVLGKEEGFTQETIDYAIHLAERLDYDLVALSVGTMPPERSTRSRWQESFRERAGAAAEIVNTMAAERGIRCDHTVKFGDLGQAVAESSHEIKRIEFVVADSDVNRAEIAGRINYPIFGVLSNDLESTGGGKIMKHNSIVSKKKQLVSTIGYGLLSASLYAAVFANSGFVMKYFTRGGWYAALPVATVFVFSFAHGSFASNLWSLLGIEAMKKDVLRQTEQKVVQKQKKATKKPRAYAYINPFHRM